MKSTQHYINLHRQHRHLGCNQYCDPPRHAIIIFSCYEYDEDGRARGSLQRWFPRLTIHDVRPALEAPIPETQYDPVLDQTTLSQYLYPYLLIYELPEGLTNDGAAHHRDATAEPPQRREQTRSLDTRVPHQAGRETAYAPDAQDQ